MFSLATNTCGAETTVNGLGKPVDPAPVTRAPYLFVVPKVAAIAVGPTMLAATHAAPAGDSRFGVVAVPQDPELKVCACV